MPQEVIDGCEEAWRRRARETQRFNVQAQREDNVMGLRLQVPLQQEVKRRCEGRSSGRYLTVQILGCSGRGKRECSVDRHDAPSSVKKKNGLYGKILGLRLGRHRDHVQTIC
jgi:hypothetical protein